MKINKLLTTGILSLCMTSAFASLNTPIGNGSIDGTNNKVANLSLAAIQGTSYAYDIDCTVIDPTGAQSPAVIKMDISNNIGINVVVWVDGQSLNTQQAALRDSKEHHFAVRALYGTALQQDSAVVLSWVGGDDVVTPINYSCFVTPSVGRK